MYILTKPTFTYEEIQIPKSYTSEQRLQYLNYMGIFGWEVCNVKNTTYLLKKRDAPKTHHFLGHDLLSIDNMLKEVKKYGFVKFLELNRP